MNVIDVSHWQGSINWNDVKNESTDGVIIKAGGSDEGFYTDSKFEENYTGAKAAGLHVGAYYFVGSNCNCYENGAADAKRFIEILNGKQFDLPVYIDFEAPNAANVYGNTQACIGFCETMEAFGYFVGIYASDISGFKDRLIMEELTPYTFWVARYGSEPVYATNWKIWQFSDEGCVNGIYGNVDLDNCIEDFPTIIINGGFNGYSKGVAPTHEVTKAIEPGTAIKIKNGACDLNSGFIFASWVYNSIYVIKEVNGNRIVFGNEDGITGVVDINNIILL